MSSAEADEDERSVSEAIRQSAAGGRAGREALTGLFRAWRSRVLTLLVRKGLPPAAAEDVAQEIFLKLARVAHQCAHGGAASAWLWRIVHNAANDWHRARNPEVVLSDEAQDALAETAAAPLAQTASNDVDDCVSRALQRFAKDHPERADAVRLLHLEGWSIAQVAAFLGRTPGATKEFLSQCRKFFGAYVQPCRHLLAA